MKINLTHTIIHTTYQSKPRLPDEPRPFTPKRSTTTNFRNLTPPQTLESLRSRPQVDLTWARLQEFEQFLRVWALTNVTDSLETTEGRLIFRSAAARLLEHK